MKNLCYIFLTSICVIVSCTNVLASVEDSNYIPNIPSVVPTKSNDIFYILGIIQWIGYIFSLGGIIWIIVKAIEMSENKEPAEKISKFICTKLIILGILFFIFNILGWFSPM